MIPASTIQLDLTLQLEQVSSIRVLETMRSILRKNVF